jgi:hypothetical protein
MIDLQILSQRGITSDALKKLFSANPEDTKDLDKEAVKRVDALKNRIRSRIQEGMTRNLKDWRWLYALDVAWETPFRQINPTLLQSLVDSGPNPNNEDVMKVVAGLGLERFVTEEKDADGKGTGKKMLDVPTFFNLLVPLVKAYVTIRMAKIVNDRINNGFLEIQPARANTINRMRTEALNARIRIMESQFSYVETFRKLVLNTLHYGTAIQFIMEEWYSETQLKKATKDDVFLGLKKKDAGGAEVNIKEDDEITVVSKEGLRYKIPHPSRQFRDLDHPLHTLNSDSGCAYVGYWSVVRYRDILNKGFWNISAVPLGNTNIIGENSAFFQTVYSACKLKIPLAEGAAAAEGGVGTGKNDAERQMSNQFYGTDQEDQGVLLTNYFEKLVPSECGLGDYAHPVWFRFVVASDSATVLYAAPLPSCPAIYAGYDPDESKDKNMSMSLEVIPFQDQFGMVLSQIVLSAKQNLANMTLINSDILDDDQVAKVRNLGEGFFRKLNIFSTSFKKMMKMKTDPEQALVSHTLPKANVAELTNVLKTILDVLERVLMMSNVEIAQQASHEQPAAEITQLAASTTSRVAYTAISIDGALDAQKRQLYEYTMAYGDEYFYAHVPSDPPLDKTHLSLLGFDYASGDILFSGDKYRRVKVNLKRLLIPLHEFAKCNFNEPQRVDAKTAASIAQLLQPLMSNPAIMQILGPQQIIGITNQMGKLVGWDDDFRLRAANKSPEQIQQEAQMQLKKTIAALMQQVDAKILADIKPLAEKVQEISKAVGAIEHAAGLADHSASPGMSPAPQPIPQNAQPLPAAAQQ